MGAAKPVRRFDPKHRPVDGVGDWTVLRNRDPNRCYVGALESNRGMFDVEYYESMAEGLELEPTDGWVVERYKGAAGVRFATGNTSRKEGDLIRFRGHVLMSCPKEFKELIDQIGTDGSGGQRAADQKQAEVDKAGTAMDPGLNVRGRNGSQYVRQYTPSAEEQQ